LVLGLDAGILTFAILLAVVFLVIAVNTLIIPEIGSSFLKIATDMPTFDYNNEQGNENFNVYSALRNISFVIYAIVLLFAGMSYMLEHFNIMSPQTAFTIISKSVLFIVLFFVFPPLWDAIALSLEQLSAWILNPSDPANAGENVKWIWQKMGGIVPPDISFDKILQFMTDPRTAGEALFKDVFMAVFKSLVTAILTFLMYVIGIVRIVLTAVLIIGLPIILILSLIPFLSRVTGTLINALIGLSLAPIFASIAIVAGKAYIGTATLSPLQDWLATLAVAALAIFFPVLLAPILGSLVTSLTTMMTAGLTSGLFFGGFATAGLAGGIRGALGAISSHAASLGRPLSSLELAKAALTTRPGLSALGRGAASGLLSGIGAGTMAGVSTMRGVGIDSEVAKLAGRMAPAILGEAGTAGARAGARAVGKFAGSATEGLLGHYALAHVPPEEVPNAVQQGKNWLSSIQSLEQQGKFVDIADEANKFLKFEEIPNKEKFGRSFSQYVGAIGQSDIGIARLYHNLNKLGKQDGIRTAARNMDLAEIARRRDMLRLDAQKSLGVTLPNPIFEQSDLIPIQTIQPFTHEDASRMKGYFYYSVLQKDNIHSDDLQKGQKILEQINVGTNDEAERMIEYYRTDLFDRPRNIEHEAHEKLVEELNKALKSIEDPRVIGRISRLSREQPRIQLDDIAINRNDLLRQAREFFPNIYDLQFKKHAH